MTITPSPASTIMKLLEPHQGVLANMTIMTLAEMLTQTLLHDTDICERAYGLLTPESGDLVRRKILSVLGEHSNAIEVMNLKPGIIVGNLTDTGETGRIVCTVRFTPQEVKLKGSSSVFDVLERAILESEQLSAKRVETWYAEAPGNWIRTHVRMLPVADIMSDADLELHYPYIPELPKILDDFVADRQKLMILYGKHGCGKSTIVSQIMARNVQSKWLVIDSEKALTCDDLIGTIRKEGYDWVVLEDAHALLETRSDGNALLSTILNAIDGTGALDTKFIVTTSKLSLSHVAPDILRPGRCFAALRFRPLSPAEATRCREAHGLPFVEFTSKATLAETLCSKQYIVTD